MTHFPSFIMNGWFLLLALPVAIAAVFIVHEMGHYLTARAFGVYVESFSIGLGREIAAWRDKKGTQWTLCLFPVCGFVHLARQKLAIRADEKPTEAEARNPAAFCNQSVWKRFLIVAAGPVANIIMAFTVLVVFFMTVGEPSIKPVLSAVMVGSPAQRAGMLPGDEILTFDGRPAIRASEIRDLVKENPGKKIALTIRRGQKTMNVNITPRLLEYTDIDGFPRKHGFSGIMVSDEPLALKAIVAIDKVDTKDDPEKARKILLRHLDDRIVITLKGNDGENHGYLVDLGRKENPALKSTETKSVYIGAERGNFYLRHSFPDAAKYAARKLSKFTTGIVNEAGRFWHVDHSLVKLETKTDRAISWWRADLYKVIHVCALVSLITALFNLVPVPGMDGSFLLGFILEAMMGPERAAVLRPYVLRMLLLLVVAMIVWRNTMIGT